jgi:beta-lactamase regulating signal transducer with metallopeptidase domain
VQAILNWLWQGCLVAAAAALLFGRARRTSATTRYTLWWVTLGAVILLPFVPLIADLAATSALPGADGAAHLPPVVLPRAPWWLEMSIVSIWAAWTLAALCQAVAALASLRRAKRTGIPLPAGREHRLRHWPVIRQTGRPATLIASGEVRVAAVLGLGSPTIAVAPAALDALDDEALDQILIHEWAHVQRRDDVARLVQVAVRALAGFHPAIWWIGRRMDIEREVACDDRVVQITGAAKRYAASLTRAASAGSNLAGTTVFATGALGRSHLRERVSRLLDRERNASTSRSGVALAAIVPALTALTLALAGVELVGTAPAIARVLERVEAVPAALNAAPDAAPASERPAGALETGTRPLPSGPTQSAPVETGKRDAGRQSTALPPVRGAITAAVPEHRSPGESIANDSEGWAPLHARPLGASIGGPVSLPLMPPPDEATGPETNARGSTQSPAPWTSAARAGAAVGRGSQKAALATAGFFSTAGKRIAGSF